MTNNTKFHVPYGGLTKLKREIAELKERELNDPNFGHYKTTHEKEFPGYPAGLYADAHRPPENGTAKSIKPPAKSEFTTTAQANFGWKQQTKEEPIRTGTASGQRRNNPHPHEAFMTWKLNKRKIAVDTEKLGAEDDSELKKILRDQVTSTYQNAFHDNTPNIKEMRARAARELENWQNPKLPPTPPPVEERAPINQRKVPQEIKAAQRAWRGQVQQEFATNANLSTNTVTYGKPVHHKHLDDNTTRYGCNKNKMNAAIGAVPTVIKYNTTQPPPCTSYKSQFAEKK